jgi:hypothetical protein
MTGPPEKAEGETPWSGALALGCLLSFVGMLVGGILRGIIGLVNSDPNGFLAGLDVAGGIFIGAAIGAVTPTVAVLIWLAWRLASSKARRNLSR